MSMPTRLVDGSPASSTQRRNNRWAADWEVETPMKYMERGAIVFGSERFKSVVEVLRKAKPAFAATCRTASNSHFHIMCRVEWRNSTRFSIRRRQNSRVRARRDRLLGVLAHGFQEARVFRKVFFRMQVHLSQAIREATLISRPRSLGSDERANFGVVSHQIYTLVSICELIVGIKHSPPHVYNQ